MADVDPLEAVIKLAAADSALNSATGGRIANRHRYGQQTGDWPLTAAALILIPAGGLARTRLNVFETQIEARAYGDTFYNANAVALALRNWSRSVAKTVIAVTGGDALVYRVTVDANGRAMIDDNIRPGDGMPAIALQLFAEVYGSTV